MFFIDNVTYHTSAEDLKFSTVTDIRYDYEHETTQNLSTEESNVSPSESTPSVAVFMMIYGLGGVLVFFTVYSLLTAYYFHFKENQDAHRQERARLTRLMNATPPTNSRSCPSFIYEDRRYSPERFEEIVSESSLSQLSPSLEEMIRPTHIDLSLGSSTPEPIVIEDISSHTSEETPSAPERRCRSSPSSCNIKRRHFHDHEETPRRPSSWN